MVTVGLCVAACSGGSDSAGPASSSSASSSASTSVTTVARAPRTYEVRHRHFTVSLQQSPGALDVFLVTPVGRGPFPLVVFGHGSGTNAQRSAALLDEIAREGFIVAGPNFTGTDIHQSAVEMSRTIDQLTSAASPLAPGRLDAKHIAVLGHSLGAFTSLAIAYNSCCRDPRLSAAVTVEGPVGDLPNGTYSLRAPPLLIVLGDSDFLVPPATGRQLLDRFLGPAYLLTIVGGDHRGGLTASDPAHAVVMRTILDFLHGYLGRDRAARERLRGSQTGAHTKFAFHSAR